MSPSPHLSSLLIMSMDPINECLFWIENNLSDQESREKEALYWSKVISIRVLGTNYVLRIWNMREQDNIGYVRSTFRLCHYINLIQRNAIKIRD